MTFQGLLVVRLDRSNEGKTVATWPWITDYANNISGPAVYGQDVLISSGYNQEKMLRIHISLDGDKGNARKIWERDLYSKVCTPIIHDGNIYWAWRKLHCLDWATGKSKWAGGKFGDAGSCIMTSDNRLIVWGGLGSLVLVDPTATRYLVLAEKRIRSRNEVWPHVVLSEGRLYCKDARGALYCFDLRRKAAPPISKPTIDVAESSIELTQWPGNHDSVVLAWQSGFGKRRVLGQVTKSKTRWRLTERDDATLSSSGAMDLTNGAVVPHGADDSLLKACRQSNQLSIEAVLRTNDTNQRGPARIISFSSDAYNRNFTLGQERGNLVIRLRTPQTGKNGSKPEITLCPISNDKSFHVIVSYRPGKLSCYLNGKRVMVTDRITGDLSNWSPQHFLFGDEWNGGRNWSGSIERFAIHSRFIGPSEAAKRAALMK
jgi:hypothetical protein